MPQVVRAGQRESASVVLPTWRGPPTKAIFSASTAAMASKR